MLEEHGAKTALELHGFEGCPNCADLKAWLGRNRIPYEWIDHPDRRERQRWYAANRIASRTMPQLFIAGEPESLGGWDAIREMAPSAIGRLLE